MLVLFILGVILTVLGGAGLWVLPPIAQIAPAAMLISGVIMFSAACVGARIRKAGQ